MLKLKQQFILCLIYNMFNKMYVHKFLLLLLRVTNIKYDMLKLKQQFILCLIYNMFNKMYVHKFLLLLLRVTNIKYDFIHALFHVNNVLKD